MGIFDRIKQFLSRKHPASVASVEPVKEKPADSPGASMEAVLDAKQPENVAPLAVNEPVTHAQQHPILAVAPSKVKESEDVPTVHGEGVELPTFEAWVLEEIHEIQNMPFFTEKEKEDREKEMERRGVFVNSKGCRVTDTALDRYFDRFVNRPRSLKKLGLIMGNEPKTATLCGKPRYSVSVNRVWSAPEATGQVEKLKVEAKKGKKKASTETA